MKVKSFFLGILAAFGALILEIIISVFFPQTASAPGGLMIFLILTVLIEELAKGFFIYRNSLELKNSQEIFSAALLVGIGFSFTETIFHFMNPISGNQEIVVLGLLGAFIIHLTTSGTMGYYLGRNPEKEFSSFLKIILLTLVIHFTYNGLIIYNWNYRIIFIYSALLVYTLPLFIFLLKKRKNA